MEITRENLLSLLRSGMDREGLGITGLEKKAGVPKDTVRDFLRGKTQILRADKLQKILRVIEPGHKVPISGTIGEGGEILFLTVPAGEVDCPPGLDPSDVSAVRVSGDAMLPLFHDGWVVYYTRRADVAIPALHGGWQVPYDKPGKKPAKKAESSAAFLNAINKPCIIRLKDGRTLLRTLKKGSRSGRYTLVGYEARDIKDVEVEDIGRIVFIKTV